MRDAGIAGQPVALESTRQTVPAVACADGDNDGRSRKAPRIRIVETKTFVFFMNCSRSSDWTARNQTISLPVYILQELAVYSRGIRKPAATSSLAHTQTGLTGNVALRGED